MKSQIELCDYNLIDKIPDDVEAIVVEGYDGVGKGRVLNMLSQYYGVTPYRPDYGFWQNYDHRKEDRWKVSGFFWDVYSHFHEQLDSSPQIHNNIMLFDRGVISGAVYNGDKSIAENYKSLLRDMKVFHILVICSSEDYKKFQLIRNPSIEYMEAHIEWLNANKFQSDYIEYLELSGVDYMIYMNEFDEKNSELFATSCIGCGHYSYGWCRHPLLTKKIEGDHPRCSYSEEKEVQDINA